MKPCSVVVVTDSMSGDHQSMETNTSHFSDKMGSRKASIKSSSPKQSFLKIFHEAQKQIEQLLKSEQQSNSTSNNKPRSKTPKKVSMGSILQEKSSTANASSSMEKSLKIRRNTVSSLPAAVPRRISKSDYYNDAAIRRESLETIRLTQLVAQREDRPDFWINGETLTEEDIEGIFDVNSTMTGYKKNVGSGSVSAPILCSTPPPPSILRRHSNVENSSDSAAPPRPPKKISYASSPSDNVYSRRLSDEDLKNSPWKQYTQNFSHLFEEQV